MRLRYLEETPKCTFGVKPTQTERLLMHGTGMAQSWRLLHTPPAGGAANMALDTALMRDAVGHDGWTLRVYGWAHPTLSFGRHQRAHVLYDPACLASAGLHVVRRPTGGRALLHDAEVTYSVTAPLATAGSLRTAYARINTILVHALRALGVDAVIAGSPEARSVSPGASPCFAHPAPGEIVVGGRKLAGSAQWRSGGALLQHGSILLSGDQRRVARLLREPVGDPPPPATLCDLLEREVSPGEVAGALFDAVRVLEDPAAEVSPLDERVAADTRRLHAAFRDPAWTWGP